MTDAALHLNPHCVNIEMVSSFTLTVISHLIKQHNHNQIHKIYYANAETQWPSFLQKLQIKKALLQETQEFCF